MKVVITDVSVFFDIHQLNILPEFFALDLEIHTTNFVFDEIRHADQRNEFDLFVRSKKLNIIRITAEEEDEINSMPLTRPNRSFPDKTILWKAKQLGCAVLTTDGKLKNEAVNLAIEVHGSIWVLDQLVNKCIISGSKCVELLEKMKRMNERSPIQEIERLIKKLKQKPKPLE